MSLPSDMARLTPNLRVLNLNYNFLEDVRALHGLTRLRKLTIIGSRVKAMREFVKMLRGMLDVEMLDFRFVYPLLIFSLLSCVLCYTSSDEIAVHVGRCRRRGSIRFALGARS
jgi:hypothetical protein